MKVICSKCGSEGSSKCPFSRTVFPTDAESIFWFGLGYEITKVKEGTGWKPGTQNLTVTMIVPSEATEEEALKDLIERFKSIPDDQLDKYVCKHNYAHTEDCLYCSHKMEPA